MVKHRLADFTAGLLNWTEYVNIAVYLRHVCLR